MSNPPQREQGRRLSCFEIISQGLTGVFERFSRTQDNTERQRAINTHKKYDKYQVIKRLDHPKGRYSCLDTSTININSGELSNRSSQDIAQEIRYKDLLRQNAGNYNLRNSIYLQEQIESAPRREHPTADSANNIRVLLKHTIEKDKIRRDMINVSNDWMGARLKQCIRPRFEEERGFVPIHSNSMRISRVSTAVNVHPSSEKKAINTTELGLFIDPTFDKNLLKRDWPKTHEELMKKQHIKKLRHDLDLPSIIQRIKKRRETFQNEIISNSVKTSSSKKDKQVETTPMLQDSEDQVRATISFGIMSERDSIDPPFHFKQPVKLREMSVQVDFLPSVDTILEQKPSELAIEFPAAANPYDYRDDKIKADTCPQELPPLIEDINKISEFFERSKQKRDSDALKESTEYSKQSLLDKQDTNDTTHIQLSKEQAENDQNYQISKVNSQQKNSEVEQNGITNPIEEDIKKVTGDEKKSEIEETQEIKEGSKGFFNIEPKRIESEKNEEENKPIEGSMFLSFANVKPKQVSEEEQGKPKSKDSGKSFFASAFEKKVTPKKIAPITSFFDSSNKPPVKENSNNPFISFHSSKPATFFKEQVESKPDFFNGTSGTGSVGMGAEVGNQSKFFAVPNSSNQAAEEKPRSKGTSILELISKKENNDFFGAPTPQHTQGIFDSRRDTGYQQPSRFEERTQQSTSFNWMSNNASASNSGGTGFFGQNNGSRIEQNNSNLWNEGHKRNNNNVAFGLDSARATDNYFGGAGAGDRGRGSGGSNPFLNFSSNEGGGGNSNLTRPILKIKRTNNFFS